MRNFFFLLFCIINSGVYSQTIIKTPWSDMVDHTNPHPEYPEPQLVREKWQSLNGQWDFAILPKGSSPETGFAGKITVPFPVESFLSGVQKPVGPENELWYERSLDLQLNPKGKRILLKFGAVDWEAEVWVNDKNVGKHQGGYDSFSFDITDFLVKGKTQKIRVRVWDPSDSGPQPRGKQVKDPKGIWYTPVTGIWQSVYVLEVPSGYISSTYSMTDWENGMQVFYPEVTSPKEGQEVEVSILDKGTVVGSFRGQANKPLPVRLQNPKTWSPDDPFLYDVSIKIFEGKKVVDQVKSYAAYRDIRMAKDQNGHQRMFLNGKPLFQYGPLDQGWWPDGLYTAPTDEALLFDIQKTKEMGFNMIRKHVKIEPARWYYHADRLGMLVWQDMPSGDMGNRWEVRPGVIREGMYKNRTAESEAIFKAEWKEIINEFRFFPSIITWVPFNEAWGQFKTAEITQMTRELDPSRLINSASGGNFEMDGTKVVGDIMDLHNYPDPVMPDPKIFGEANILVLGEFGGLGLPLEGHTWQQKDNWGYQSFSTQEELKARYMILLEDLVELIPKGLAAAIYTQTTDVEVETNGLMTYDRQVIKIAVEELRKAHEKLYK
ncbi:glycoside hydrolase family 2 protein [Algoriphagus boritolerans]|uniref:Glycosyl hydrolases family 2, TIM barrel domain n=1 Tax=Algoriphagus boritolerans DSM 17298 = JCM 18970 TaxID=1120964 RepID=A0A1H5TLI6_9BACT|nr:sugar-binding domain-containing protein [Algoriphagus boritolerans]SEF63636.1 Glycosyl hydrolases family 2, TIM barrel domain [Algoriphagus boritolerans DSM 17298 = JCM 18970]